MSLHSSPYDEAPTATQPRLDWQRIPSLPRGALRRKAWARLRSGLFRSRFNRPCATEALDGLMAPRSPGSERSARLKPTSRFFFRPEQVDPLSREAQRLFPDAVEQMIADAEEIERGRFRFLGYPEVSFPGPIQWWGNPVAEVDVYLNRMDFLVTLALAFAYSRRTTFRQALIERLSEWLETEGRASYLKSEQSIEISIRIINWTFALHIVEPLEEIARSRPDLPVRIAGALEAQLRLLENSLSAGANHLLLEALGLRIVSAGFPNLERASAREKLGMSLLDRELFRQVRVDGVHTEQSAGYHLNVTTYFVKDLLLRQARGQRIAQKARHRIGDSIDYACHITKADGSIAMFGDLDGFRTRYREHLETRILYPAGLAIFPHVGTTYPPHLDTDFSLWYLGSDTTHRARSMNRPGSHPRSPTSKAYPAGGVYLLRTPIPPNAPSVIFDCGPFGMEEFPHHGHADCLSVEVSLDGKPAIVDPGGFAYHRNAYRHYFRSTIAHNTVRVDGVDQTPVADRFKVGKLAKPIPEHFEFNPRYGFVEGAHTGYLRLADPVTHRRAVVVVFEEPGYVLIIDQMSGNGRHLIEQSFQLVPTEEDPVLFAEGVKAPLDPDTSLLLLTPTPDSGEPPSEFVVSRGQTDPVRGWVSKVKGQLESAPHICRRAVLYLPEVLVTGLFAIPGSSRTTAKLPIIERLETPSRPGRNPTEGSISIRIRWDTTCDTHHLSNTVTEANTSEARRPPARYGFERVTS